MTSPSVATGQDSEIPALEDITDEEVEAASAGRSKETTPKGTKLKVPQSKLTLLSCYLLFLKSTASAGLMDSACVYIFIYIANFCHLINVIILYIPSFLYLQQSCSPS